MLTPKVPSRLPVEFALLKGLWALTVDVEEWFHNCWHPDYVDPQHRPILEVELDRLLPELLDNLDRVGVSATFFVLGEVAKVFPRTLAEVTRCGHEVACHGDLHFRVDSRSRKQWKVGLAESKARLEDITGKQVLGYRAPEWSLRTWQHPWFEDLKEVGFLYDSSLVSAWGAGVRENPRTVTEFLFGRDRSLWEFPPLVLPGGLPAGGWTGRLVGDRFWRSFFLRERARGAFPVVVVHPWELTDRPLPGVLTGFARFFHEVGRYGFGARFWRRLEPEGARTLGAIGRYLEQERDAKGAFLGRVSETGPLSRSISQPSVVSPR